MSLQGTLSSVFIESVVRNVVNLLSVRTLNVRLQKMVTTIGRRRKAGLKRINQVRGIEKLYLK